MSDTPKAAGKGTKRVRADAQRSIDALVEAAKSVFTESGVDAPVREIAERAGVGIGTLYRNFPDRADLVVAVFRREVDACAAAAAALAANHAPAEALALWLRRYASFIGTKRGLAPALHSGNPAFNTLQAYFHQNLEPALRGLLDAAIAAGEIRSDIHEEELLTAVAVLWHSAYAHSPERAERMLALVIDGLRAGARQR